MEKEEISPWHAPGRDVRSPSALTLAVDAVVACGRTGPGLNLLHLTWVISNYCLPVRWGESTGNELQPPVASPPFASMILPYFPVFSHRSSLAFSSQSCFDT